MLNKIQTIILKDHPSKVCKTSKELNTEMQKFVGKKICTFIGLVQDNYYLMFTAVEGDDIIAVADAVAFEAPCPPYCGKGGGGGNDALYVMT
jgi:hypothetical protein